MKILESLPNLEDASALEASIFILAYIKKTIPNSSTKRSLSPMGYPETGEIELTIRNYRASTKTPKLNAIKALETGCGNCQEMAYAGALILRQAGFMGKISIGQYGINHQFLFIEKLIADPWAQMICSTNDWQGNLFAYGGSIKNDRLYGRLIASSHEELEDESPELIESISTLENFTTHYLLTKKVQPLTLSLPHLLWSNNENPLEFNADDRSSKKYNVK